MIDSHDIIKLCHSTDTLCPPAVAVLLHNIPSEKRIAPEPVSYTHLDVYKRQVKYLPLAPAMSSMPSSVATSPVSYTHLVSMSILLHRRRERASKVLIAIVNVHVTTDRCV